MSNGHHIIENPAEFWFCIGYLSSILYIVLLAWTGSDTAGGGGTGLFCSAQYNGVLVEVTCPLHCHCHCAGFLTHIVAVEPSQEVTGARGYAI